MICNEPNDCTDVVYSYTCVQGVEDGMYAHPYPKRLPWLLVTASVYAAVVSKAEARGVDLDAVLVPLLMDCIMVSRNQWNPREDRLYTGDALDGNCTGGPLWLAVNEMGGMTVLSPDDY